jgi:hypothetical protein
MSYHWSEKTSHAIIALAEEAARDHDLDPEEFLFIEGDDLYTKVEALVIGLWEQIEEVMQVPEERRQVLRDLEAGAPVLVYRGHQIGVNENERGRTYDFEGREYEGPLEVVCDLIDERMGEAGQ